MKKRVKAAQKPHGRRNPARRSSPRVAAAKPARSHQSSAALERTLALRTRELQETLEQQAATAEVLRVISSSPGDLGPVFQTMLENAVRLCEAKFGTMLRYDGDAFHLAAGTGTPQALVDFQKQRGPFRPGGGGPVDQLLQAKRVIHIADQAAEPVPGLSAKLGGARSTVAVPMLKDNELIGGFVIYRQEVRPFTGKQIELVTNFAAQAVIAIENTRLLNELRQRTADLTESLEQQTATSEVLQVISSSRGELEPVFSTMLKNAVRICEAKFGTLYLCEDGGFRAVAMHNAPPAFAQARASLAHPRPDTSLGGVFHRREPVQIADVTASQAYLE